MDETELFKAWALTFRRRAEEKTIAGSPNRSSERFVWEDARGKLFVAEGFPLSKRQSQRRQAAQMEFLAERNFPVQPWLRTEKAEEGVTSGACFWQIRPYVPADPLPRETLGENRAIAALWESLLWQMREISLGPSLPPMPPERFSFAHYLTTLRHYLDHRMGDLGGELRTVLSALEPFLAAEPSLPAALAHGDFHPGNILLKENAVSAVIDWEFFSWKCAGYDLALLTGCLGMDQIGWLVAGAAAEMRERMFARGYLPAPVRAFFPELVAAVRLGWLGEWVDLNDREMAEKELYYIRMILHNRAYLL